MKNKTLFLTIALIIGVSFFIGVNFVAAVDVWGDGATTTPTITVISPNGGETLTIGQPYTITWQHTLASSTPGLENLVWDVALGFSWSIVRSLPFSQTSYTWNIPASFSAVGVDPHVQVTLRKNCVTPGIPCPEPSELFPNNTHFPYSPDVYDTSDEPFNFASSTNNLPDLTVTSIQFGSTTTIYAGDNHTLSVTIKNLGGDLTSSQGLLNWYNNFSNQGFVFSSSTPSITSFQLNRALPTAADPLRTNESIVFSWIGSFNSAGTKYLDLTVNNSHELVESNYSNNVLQISVIVTTPSITVLSPNGGEDWVRGTQKTVTWEGSSAGGTVGVHLIKDPSPYPCAGTGESCFAGAQWVVPNTGSFTWTVGQVADDTVIRSMPNGSYRFQVCHSTLGCDSSNGTFNIVSTTTPPSITVLSPNGGQTYQSGRTMYISWNGGYGSDHIVIDLLQVSGNSYLPVPGSSRVNINNSGSYNLTVPSVPTASNYVIGVGILNTSSGSMTAYGYSGMFTINASTTPPAQPWCSVNIPPATASSTYPQRLFNINFGVSVNSSVDPQYVKTGPAVVGSAGDYWNAVAVPWCDDHTKSNLKNANNSSSPITVRMKNLGGSWRTSSSLAMGYITSDQVVGLVKTDTMLDGFNYPASNKGGDAYVILYNVPAGAYDLYLYNKTANAGQYGDYTVTVGGREYGRKLTSSVPGSERSAQWEENNQYVKFAIEVRTAGEQVQVRIQPHVGVLRDAQIGGLQLSPAGAPVVVPIIQYATSTPIVDTQITQITESSELLYNDQIEDILAQINQIRDMLKEQQTEVKYLSSLIKNVQGLTEQIKDTLNNFITYGVDENTKLLGAGERAAVINSYKIAFSKLPGNEAELADAIKIANGRFPLVTSDKAEKAAKEQFIKIYKRIPDLNDANDNAAIKVMAYGLRQKAKNRNLNSEKSGIKSFQSIFGVTPKTTQDWNAMQAITYSGSTREKDSDGDLLTDAQELRYGTNPNKSDTDGDGYVDGREVLNGFSPI